MNNGRALIILLGLFLVFILLVSNLFNLQISKHEKYKFLAEKQQNSQDIIKAQRGFIKDRNGKVLAYTNNDVSFFVDTRMLKKNENNKIAEIFSKVFNKKENYYLNLIKNAKRNVCLEKKATLDKALLISDFTIDALYKTEDYSRIYPYSSKGSHVIGYVDTKINGVAGIEKQYDELLKGKNGLRYIEQDVLGRLVSVNEELSITPEKGNDIQLTINNDFQNILEEELVKGINKYEGKTGVGIVMNPNSGEILAMASSPTYDPANYNLFPDSTRRNRVLTDTYEPGSTIKSIVMSMLIEENITNENELINTEHGKYRIKGATIRDTHEYDILTVQEVLENSSNVGIVKLSDKIDDKTFYKYFRDFGFGNKTSIELPGETAGFLKKPEQYSKISKAFISHGYEISVTPLQVITAFSALINGGELLKPYVLKEVADSYGNIIEKNEKTKIRKVISKETSERIINMMIGVVENGTGKAAQLDNILVGGKTGTAQKLINGRYSNKNHNSSFVGFFPADNPQIVCLILIDSPQKGRYGGQVAAPIFKEIAKRICEADLNITPNKEMPNRNKNRIEQLFADIGNDSSENILQSLNKGESKKIKKENIDFSNRTTMPDLKTIHLEKAVSSLAQLGLKYKVVGTGKVVEQSINAGAKINDEDVIIIKCRTTEKLKGLKIN